MAEDKTKDVFLEGWMKGVAITTTVLAVMTAIVSARSATCVAKIQVLTAREGSQWSYYQAKSIKHNIAETQAQNMGLALLGATKSEHRKALEDAQKQLTAEVQRYAKEKEEIRQAAEDVGRQNLQVQMQNNQFVIAVALFQIAIMLSSVAALVKRKWVWFIGLVFGVPALIFFANGFLLFYKPPFVF